jgi:two-component system, LytTR family, sensor kinase
LTYVFFKTYLNYATQNFTDPEKSELDQFIQSLIPQFLLLSVKLPLVYALFAVITHYFSKKWSIAKVIFITIILFAVAVFLYIIANNLIFLDSWHNNYYLLIEDISLGSVLYSLFILFFVSGLAVTIKLIRINIRQNKLSQELLKMKLETELNLLKSQVNPHFLFNTLNNIYSLAIKKSDDTAPVVMRLSKLLRFMLYESSKESISIVEEIKLLEDYIELEKIRYSDRLSIRFKTFIQSPSEKITPLLLLPLVENVFKHGTSESTNNAFIDIEIIEKNSLLTIIVKNSKENAKDEPMNEGIGLKNLKRQLELTYSDFTLEIENNPNTFEVKLTVNLKSYGKN